VLELAEQETQSLRDLLKTPTPENFEIVTLKLGDLAAALQSFAQADATEKASSVDRAFLLRLPFEMAHVNRLLGAPVSLLEGLRVFRAQKFGSYDCLGQLRGFEPGIAARTVTDL
jgi:hypothetical protein